MKQLLTLFLVVFSLTACEKLFFKKNKATGDPYANFEYLWEQVRDKYSYLELKGVDWNAIHDEYHTKLYAGMSDDELFTVMGAMLNELRDDHSNLISPFNISVYKTDKLGQDNFDFRIIEDNYLSNDYYISGPFIHDFIQGTNEEIAYIRFASFTGGVNSQNLDFALNKYANTKGIILDLRENGGGDVSDVYALLSRFVDQKTLAFYSRIKNGPGINDFTAPEAGYVEPHTGTRYLKKVVMLTDRGTFSAGSFTALGTKAIDNIVMIGDTTGGGLGLPNGGQLPNGWNYRFSVSQALDLNFDPQFENGVPPEITVLMDWSTPTSDEVLDRAILEIQ